tara:strand:- start:438 stop:1073 length:636 start_codon:yes stop_codon:yes gene_type:complete
MKITILCTNKNHPVYPHLLRWVSQNSDAHNISLVNKSSEIKDGKILFLIACSEIINDDIKIKFDKVLCVHESNLPEGKGWSPCVHYILDGKNEISLTLFEISEKVDSGDIWEKTSFNLEGHELHDEINNLVSIKTLQLMDFTIENFGSITPKPQEKSGESFFPRRFPSDSELDVNKTISQQFNQLRIADENRYPCFFLHKGHRYKITIRKF